MQMTITVITSHFLFEITKASLERISPGCRYRVAAYDDFCQITQVYERWEEESDGFLVSGPAAADVLRQAHPHLDKPIMSFQEDESALYKALLEMILKNRQQDPRRVVLDFLIPLDCGYTLSDFLCLGEIGFIEEGNLSWMKRHGSADQLEPYIAERLIGLWEQGEMDIAVCQYSSIIPCLRERGIPCIYPFLSDERLFEIVREMLNKIEMDRLRANLPAVIYIVPSEPEHLAEMEARVRACLGENLFAGHMEACPEQLTLYTTWQVVRYLTKNASACILTGCLQEEPSYRADVGYGVGTTEAQAAANARIALSEAQFCGGSFLMDETDVLLGPLGAQEQSVLESEQTVNVLAQRCSLSPISIRRILAYVRMNHSNMLTARDLASRFGVTVRNANRILTRLVEGGLARFAYVQSENVRGRPGKVYELQLNLLEEKKPEKP